MRAWGPGLVLAALALSGASAAWAGGAEAPPSSETGRMPVVHPPEGFVELAHGVPDRLAGKLPPFVEQQAHAGAHLAYALDLDHPSGGFIANMLADVHPGVLPDASKILSAQGEIVQGVEKGYPPGTVVKIASARPVSVGIFRGARILLDVQQPGGSIRQLLYLLPLGKENLVLTYTAGPSSYDTYEPRFDASAMATTGLENPPSAVSATLQVIATSAVTGMVGALAASRVARKWRKKATAPRNGPSPGK
jgi:hypothetical protein